MRSRPRASTYAILVGVLCIVYATALGNGFTFDDIEVVANNRHVRAWNNLTLMFSPSYFRAFAEYSYRPLLTFTYFVDWALGRGRANWFHLTNLIFHAANVCLLLRLCSVSGVSGPIACCTAMLFGLHPVNSEVVCGIAFREDALALFFMLCALNMFAADRGNWLRRSAGLMCFALALLSKEMALVFPVVVAAYDLLMRRRRRTALYACLLIVAVLYAGVRFGLMRGPEAATRRTPILADVTRAGSHSAVLLLLPIHLAPDHGGTSVAYSPALCAAWAAALLGLLLCVLAARERRATVAFGAAWLVLLFAPVAGLVPIRNLVAERHLYAPAAGLCLLIASACWRRRGAVYLGFVIVSFTLLTAQRCFAWRDSFALWTATVRTSPNSFRALSNLAREAERKTSPLRAVILARNAVRLAPQYADAYANLGRHLLAAGRYDAAERALHRALEIKPNHAKAHGWLIETLRRRKKCEAALRAGEEAVRRVPGAPFVRNQYGQVLLHYGRWDEAQREFEAALRSDPRFAPAHNNLAGCLLKRGRMREAIRHYKAAIRSDPRLVEPYVNLAKIYAQSGDLRRAQAFMREAKRIDPARATWQGPRQEETP